MAFQCQVCYREMVNGESDKVLLGCECIICPACCIFSLRKGVFTCPCNPEHGCPTIEFQYGSNPPETQSGENPQFRFQPREDTLLEDPFGYLKRMPKAKRRGQCTLAYYQYTGGENGEHIKKVVEWNTYDGKKGLSKMNQDQLVLIAMFLHQAVFKGFKATDSMTSDDTDSSKKASAEKFLDSIMTAQEVSQFAETDDRLLTRFLFALGTGSAEVMQDKLTIHEYKSRVMACFIAAELLRRINSTRLHPFQAMMSLLLDNNNVSDQLKRLLTKWKLCASPDMMNSWHNDGTIEYLQQGVELDPLDCLGLGADNIGFNKRPGYIQLCVILGYTMKRDMLQKIGFYNPIPEQRLSRKRTTWEEYMDRYEQNDDAIARSIVEVTGDDISKLSNYVFKILDYVCSDVEFPSLERCKEMADADDYSSWKPSYKENLGVDLDLSTLGDLDDLGEAEAVQEVLTLLERNNAYIECRDIDPNSQIAVRSLMEMAKKVSLAARNRGYDETQSNGEEPVQYMGCTFVVDGKPLTEYFRIRDQMILDGDDTPSYVDFKPGPLHVDIESHRMHGLLFKEPFGMYVREYRYTRAQQDYVLCPHDPRVVARLMTEHVLAHMVAAKHCFEEENPGVHASPKKVDEHMRLCSQDNPLAQVALVELRFAVVDFMLRDTKKLGPGGVGLFVSTLRLLLPKFCAAHAIHYVRIVCEFLEWYALASEADIVLYKEFHFVKYTQSGKPLFTDETMEWSIGGLREFLGKYAFKNQFGRLQRACAVLARRMISRREQREAVRGTTSGTIPWNEKLFKLSKVFCKTYMKCRELRVWNRPQTNGQQTFDIPGQGPLSSAILRCFSIGSARAIQYYILHHITNRGSLVRSEKDASLALLPSCAKKAKGGLAAVIKIRTSTSILELQPHRILTVSMIREELVWLREIYTEDIPEERDLNKLNRNPLLVLLCQWRTRYYEDFPGMQEWLIQLIGAEYATATVSSRSERVAETKIPFIALDINVRNMFDT